MTGGLWLERRGEERKKADFGVGKQAKNKKEQPKQSKAKHQAHQQKSFSRRQKLKAKKLAS